MKAIAAMRLPVSVDLGGFIALLRRLQVPHRVTEIAGEQVLWVGAETIAEQVRALYAQHPHGDGVELVAAPPVNPSGTVLQRLRATPMTTALLLITFLVALVTWGGSNLQMVRWLSFLDFSVQGDYLYFVPWSQSMAQGQWWRLISPALLHFGLLHLAMNSMWCWELGRRIELRQGALTLLSLLLLYSLVSDLAQYYWSGPGLFGGLSGVLYGLLGHCWIYQKLAPDRTYRLPPGVVGMMLIWLLICMTGIFELVQLAAIANAAHVGGLLAGCLTGLLGGALARQRK